MNSSESSFHFEGPILRVHYVGRFSESSVVSLIAAFSSDPRILQIEGVMWDLQSADVSDLNLEMMKRVFRMQTPLRTNGANRTIRIAAVVGSETDLQILRLWAVGPGAKDSFQRGCFRDSDEARSWLLDSGGR